MQILTNSTDDDVSPFPPYLIFYRKKAATNFIAS